MNKYEEYLIEYGFKTHYNGFAFLAKAIELYEPLIKMSGKKGLNRKVASFYATTPDNVGHSINYLFIRYFRDKPNVIPPTLSEFISLSYYKLKEQTT